MRKFRRVKRDKKTNVPSKYLAGAKNKAAKAKEINEKLMPLHKSLFIESNPSPVKYAASLLKLSSPTVRLPLVEVKKKTKDEEFIKFKN